MSRLFFLLVFIQIVAVSSARASLIPIDWALSTGIVNSGGSDGTYFLDPMPNFSNSHIVNNAGSASSASYAIAIANASAQYLIHVQHSCVQTNFNRPFCVSEGRITLTPRFDVLVDVAIAYAYTMPSDPMDIDFGVFAFLPVSDTPVYGNFLYDTTDLVGPHSGNQSFTGSFILPANQTAEVSYLFRTRYSSGSANGLTALGDGNLHMTMTALPEPGTLGLLALAAGPLARRRARRH